MSKALYRKYRPSQFSDVFGQKHIVKTVQNQIADNNVAHAYLFSGPRGIGKTTIARLLAKTVNCEGRDGKSEPCGNCSNCLAFNKKHALDIIEIDAASNTGVDNVRENIIEAIRFAPTSGSFKVFIIDEVHMLSSSAFNALLKTLEEPPEYGIFILATTEIHKIPPTIISRCQRFDFHRLTESEIVERLELILKAEGFEVDINVLKIISKLSEGCLRDAESLLSQIMALGEKKITEDLASIVLPRTNIETVKAILSACEELNPAFAVKELQEFVEQGGSVKRLNDDLIEECRLRMMNDLSSKNNKVDWYRLAVEAFLKARVTIAPEIIPHLPLELAIIEICGFGKGSIEKDQTGEDSNADKTPSIDRSVLMEEPPKRERYKSEEEYNTASKAVFKINDIRSKWGRCCDEVAKVNIVLPLALRDAKIIEVSDKELSLGFEKQFHADSVANRRNLEVISDAIERVMKYKLAVITRFLPPEDQDKPLKNLTDAFGGAIVK